MDEDETLEDVDFGIEVGDIVLVETETGLSAGRFMALTTAGFHVQITHELGEVAEKLSEQACANIRESVAGLHWFELVMLARTLKVSTPWAYRKARLAETVRIIMEIENTPAPKQVLKAQAYPIRRIIPEHTVVSIDKFDDWQHNMTLQGLDFEVESPVVEEEETA